MANRIVQQRKYPITVEHPESGSKWWNTWNKYPSDPSGIIKNRERTTLLLTNKVEIEQNYVDIELPIVYNKLDISLNTFIINGRVFCRHSTDMTK